jgi:SRSO17 transposase
LKKETLPENSTVFVMTNLQGNIKKSLGNLYGLRTWIEYGFRQDKQELGWTDYRFTHILHQYKCSGCQVVALDERKGRETKR